MRTLTPQMRQVMMDGFLDELRSIQKEAGLKDLPGVSHIARVAAGAGKLPRQVFSSVSEIPGHVMRTPLVRIPSQAVTRIQDLGDEGLVRAHAHLPAPLQDATGMMLEQLNDPTNAGTFSTILRKTLGA